MTPPRAVGPDARPPRPRRRRIRWWILVALCAAALFAAKRFGDFMVLRTLRSFRPGPPPRLETHTSEHRNGYRVEAFTVEQPPEAGLPVLALLPESTDRRHAAVVFLYGIGMKTGMRLDASPEVEAVAAAFSGAGFAVFIPEQYGRGARGRKKGRGVGELFALRHRMVLTIREAGLLVDALSARPDIDPDRIYLWGVSFGAMTGVSVAAYDPRIRAAVLTAGAGDFALMARDSSYIRAKGIFSVEYWGARALAGVIRPFDPVRHVGRIAPRPLLFQNATQDELLPRSAVEALYAAACEPKEIRWIDSVHNRPPQEAVDQIVREGLVWLQALDVAPPSRSSPRAIRDGPTADGADEQMEQIGTHNL